MFEHFAAVQWKSGMAFVHLHRLALFSYLEIIPVREWIHNEWENKMQRVGEPASHSMGGRLPAHANHIKKLTLWKVIRKYHLTKTSLLPTPERNLSCDGSSVPVSISSHSHKSHSPSPRYVQMDESNDDGEENKKKRRICGAHIPNTKKLFR